MLKLFKKRYVCINDSWVSVDNEGIHWCGSGGGKNIKETKEAIKGMKRDVKQKQNTIYLFEQAIKLYRKKYNK